MYKQQFTRYKLTMKSFLFIFFLCTSKVFAQNITSVLDTTFLKCEYKTNYYTDTLAMDNGIWMNDEFILQVGQKTSKYYSKLTDAYDKARSDPKVWEAYSKEIVLALEKAKNSGGHIEKAPLARYGTLVIYNNYPPGQRTIHDAIFFDYYIFEDDNLPQQWTMVADSVKTILGYKCRKAVCIYRGRDYEAWYALDLPVNVGPWKFSGLPGLIMSVQDTKGHYTFEISGLEKTKEPIEYIEYGARKYTRTDRMTFLRTNAKASNIGWVRYLEANSPKKNESDFIPTSGGARYNFLERDF